MDINLNEISINNYLEVKKGNKFYDLLLEEVRHSFIVVKTIEESNGNYLINQIPVEYLIPIMINRDWLKKFKFTWNIDHDEWLQNSDGSGLIIRRHDEYWDRWKIELPGVSIMYVHQLQNISKILYKKDII